MGAVFGSQRAWWMFILCLLAAHAVRASPNDIDFKGRRASPEARLIAAWALNARNAQGKPFAIVDKREARLFVFSADGQLAGEAPVLLGLARGDYAVALNKAVFELEPHERTTPAGRFESEPGHNDKGEAIVWFDYDASLAIHRLRPAPPNQRRVQRLSTDDPDDNRVSFGCVVVPPAFYDEVVAPLLGRQRGVVYVLPESRQPAALFDMTVGSIR